MDEYSVIKKKNEQEEKRKKKKGIFAIIGDRMKHGRLLFLLVAFILTLIGLTTSTYAWFTSNYTVSVAQIDVNVSSGSGIQISTNAETWKSMIILSDITTNHYDGAVNQVPAAADQVNPVSTVKEAYTSASTYSSGLHMYKGTIVSDESTGTQYLNTESQTDGAEGSLNYIAFDLFLKLDFRESGNKQIYLTSNTGITTATGGPNTFIEYAGRMGFVIQGTMASTADLTQIKQMKGTPGTVLIYEPNYDVHTNNGLVNGRDNYGITGYAASGNANPVPYYGVKDAFAYSSSVPNSGTPLNSTDSTKFAAVTPDLTTPFGNSQNFAFTQLPVGVTKIRVYMWIEGQDIDCENTASGGKVSFNLGFSLDPPSTPGPTATS